MKTKLFSGRLYKEALRQLRLPGISLFAILFFTSILLPLSYLLTNRTNMYGGDYITNLTAFEFAPILLGYMYVAPFIMVLILFNFLNKRSKSDFYHGLPHNRYSIFLSFFAAVLTVLYISITITVLTCGFLYSLADNVIFDPTYMISVSLVNMAGSTLVGAATAIAMCLTGTFISNVSVTMIVMFLPRLVLALIMNIISAITEIVPTIGTGILGNISYNIPVSLILGAAFGTNSDKIFSFVGGIVYTFALGILFIAIGAILFNRRSSETAEKSSPSPLLQHTYRILVTFPFTLIITGSLLVSKRPLEAISNNMILYITLLIVCLLVYYLFEIITTKKWKNLLKATPVLLVLVALNLVFALAVFVGKTYTLSYSPDAEQIQWVELDDLSYNRYGNYGYRDNTYGSKVIENIKFREVRIREIIAEALEDNIEKVRSNNNSYNYEKYRMMFKIKSNGSTAKLRNIEFNSKQYKELQIALAENEEYSEAVTKLPKEMDIQHIYIEMQVYNLIDNETQELYKMFREEYTSLPLEMQRMIASQNVTFTGNYYSDREDKMGLNDMYTYLGEPVAHLVLQGEYENSWYRNSYFITKATPKTYQYLIEKNMEYSREDAINLMKLWLDGQRSQVTFSLRGHMDPTTIGSQKFKLALHFNRTISEIEKDKEYLDIILKMMLAASNKPLNIEEPVYTLTTEDSFTGIRHVIYFNLSEVEANKVSEAASNIIVRHN